jgi:hypothetical protein
MEPSPANYYGDQAQLAGVEVLQRYFFGADIAT